MRIAILLLVASSLSECPVASYAQTATQVDLSGSASMTPASFVPGGQGTFTLTIQNAGPDAAGTDGIGSITAYGTPYIVTSQPPPFELTNPVVGDCFVERAVTEPLPDGNIGLTFIFYFDAIPAGESRSCTTGIYFYPSTRMDVPTTWEIFGKPYNSDDTNLDNNLVEYVFRLRRVSVPGASPLALLLLGLGLLMAGGLTLRNQRRRRIVRDRRCCT